VRKLFILFTLAIFTTSCDSSEKKQLPEVTPTETTMTTYYLIRHAEKDRTDPTNNNPNLTEAGLSRAKNWAVFFKNVSLDQVYSTNYNRTQQTAQFVAMDKNLEVQTYDPGKLNSEAFQKQTKGKTVLVVGHSNTTPQFVNAIIGETTYPDMDDGDNVSVYVVSLINDIKKVEILTVH
jgi:broad specificity phosphatase PhoE